MSPNLKEIYKEYLSCLNAQDWENLSRFVADDVTHNQNLLGLSGYRDMLRKDYEDIPDLHFNAVIVICEPPVLAARLKFDCHPKGEFMGLPINGNNVIFHENVFYEFERDKIVRVRSAIDKAAIEAQL